MIRSGALGLCLAVALSVSASAQGIGSGHGTGADSSGQKLPSPAAGPLVQVSANSDAKTATLSLAFNLWRLPKGDMFGAENIRTQYFTLSAQTPLTAGATYTNIATLDGLTNATAIKFKYTYVSGNFIQTDNDRSDLYQARCHAVMARAGSPIPANVRCVAEDDVENMISGLRATDQKLFAQLNDPASQPTIEQKTKIYAQLSQDRKREAILADGVKTLQKDDAVALGPFWILGASGQVGYTEHKYFDAISLAALSQTKTPFDIGAEVTRVFDKGHASLNLGFDYQESYQDGMKGATQIECKSAATPTFPCVSGFIGPPKFQQRDLIHADLRYILKPWGFPIGIDPGVVYDAKANSEAVQFPIYLVSGTDGGLTGGVRYDWTSAKHVSVIGIFASAAFSIFGEE